MGIIDYLQTWDINKKTEHFLKRGLATQAVTTGISAVNPLAYRSRFIAFMDSELIKAYSQSSYENEVIHKFGEIHQKWSAFLTPEQLSKEDNSGISGSFDQSLTVEIKTS